MERNTDGCFTNLSPPALAGGLDTRTTRIHKNTITNGSRTLFSDRETGTTEHMITTTHLKKCSPCLKGTGLNSKRRLK